MNENGFFAVKPGLIVLIVFMAAFGLGVFTWASSSLTEAGEGSLEDQENAIDCSNLEISNSGIQQSGNQVTLFFKSNSDLEEIDLNFEGENNLSREVKDVQEGQINSVTANVSNFSVVSLKAPDCSRVFSFE